MQSFQKLFVGVKSRPKAHFGLVLLALANHFTVVAFAAPSVSALLSGDVHAQRPVELACTHAPQGCAAGGSDSLQLSLPDGGQPCPGSDQVAACSAAEGTQNPAPGVASTPDGHAACAGTALSTPAACTDTVLPPQPADGGSKLGGPAPINPSVPPTSLDPSGLQGRLDLAVDANVLQPNHPVTLTATASNTVTGSNTALEIFDHTTGTLAGACTQGSQCIVSYAAKSGAHSFAAFITQPSDKLPSGALVTTSNIVTVNWISVTLTTQNGVVGPGREVTITATASSAVDRSGYQLQVFDANTKSRLTYCSQGSSCSTSLSQPIGGVHSVIATLAKPSATFPAPATQAQSDPLALTWLTVSIQGSASGSTVHLSATANANLTHTPWSLGLFDQQGNLVAPVCKTGKSCSADVPFSGDIPHFSAAIGAVPPPDATTKLGQVMRKVAGPASLVNIQARSVSIKPDIVRMLWGVDSCKSFTDDPNAGSGLYRQVASRLGTPDFWGRYLTDTVCPRISAAEMQAAHSRHMAILPIYNDYNCSNVVGYDTGKQYGVEATAAAARLGIPQGRAVIVDIEPPGDACPGAANVDSGFIEGWYDGVATAGYVPAYYGNGGAGTEFGSAYCAAVTERPEVADNSHLWTFEPSLWGNFNKAHAPDWGLAYNTHCPEHGTIWQYMLSAGGDPDVDHDLLLSEFPLWYP